MTTMISEVYSAFKTAGVPEQEAQQAAEAMSAENLATRKAFAEDKRELSNGIAGAEQRLSGEIAAVRQEVVAVEQKLSDKIAAVRQEVATVEQKLSDKIAAVRQEVATVEQKLSDKIAAVRQEVATVEQKLSDKIAAVKQELSDKIADGQKQLSAEISEVRRIMSVIRWMLGFMLFAMALPILREIIAAWP